MVIWLIAAACMFAIALAWMAIDTHRMKIHADIMEVVFKENVEICRKRAEIRAATARLEEELSKKVEEVARAKSEKGIETRRQEDQSTDTQLIKSVDLKLADARRLAAQRGFML